MPRYLSRPAQWVRRRWQRIRFGARAVILAYHRVGEPGQDPFELCVKPGTFAQHLEVVRRFGSVVRFDRLFESLTASDAPVEQICITFDDGYADNLLVARPILERYDVPATVFVTTDHIDSDREFWWDELERLVAESGPPYVLPPEFDESGGGAGVRVGSFEEAFRRAYDRLFGLHPDERERLLDRLAGQRGRPVARATHRTLRSREIVALADGGLVEIGAHTVTHPPLDRLDVEAQRREIAASKSRLEEILGAGVVSFAYPHGRYGRATPGIVAEAGFRQACTVHHSAVWQGTDPFLVPRIVVGEWDADELARRLAWWLGRSPKRRRRA